MLYREIVTEILASAKTSTADKTRLILVFQASGIEVDQNLSFVSFHGPENLCVNSLVEKLSYLPALKAPTQQILRKWGITFDGLDEY